MISILAILAISLFCIFVEFFIPGGVVGAIGGLGLLFSLYKYSQYDPSPFNLLIYSLFCVFSLVFVIRLAMKKIQNSRSSGVYNNDDQEGFLATEFHKDVIGQSAIAVSDLKPSGFIELEGRRLQALSKAGYIPKGSKVHIISGEGGHVNVVNDEQIKDV